MKSLILCLIILLSSFSLAARTIESKFHSIDEGQYKEDHLLRLMDGEVVFIPFGEKNLLKDLEVLEQGDELTLEIDKKQNLISFRFLNHSEPVLKSSAISPYTPSVITLKQAGTIFNRMSKKYQNKSQCFNRAHIWVYDEYVRSKTNLNKVFLFFTSRYIRKYKFHWWFHVTPMAYVGGSNFSNWRMLDRRYTKGPLQSKTWTDIFIKSKKACKVVDRFSQYFNNQKSQDCYMIRASQYYLVPSDLDMLETNGTERTIFDPIEIEHARWEAF